MASSSTDRRPMLAPNQLLWVGVAFLQVLLAGLFLLDWRLPVAATLAGMLGVLALLHPMVAVAGLLGGRILSTGSMSFLRIGGLNIGVFEPMLGLALAVLLVRAAQTRRSLTPWFPWRHALVFFWAWQGLGVLWANNAGKGLSELVAVGVIVATTTVLLVFVDDYDKFEKAVMAWIGASVLTAILSVTTDFTDVAVTGKTWEIASGGGRETGLGQQPNWFAMNLMFGVALAFASSVIQKTGLQRLGMLAVGLFLLLAQLRSGSRGGTYALVIGAFVMSLGLPLVRKWVARISVLVVILGIGWSFLGDDSTSKALNRILMNLGNTWGSDIRERNWMVCLNMFVDTWGRGIGPGGYQELVAQYDWKIYDSIHRYPHGILWGLIGHYGAVGVCCAAVLTRQLYKMNSELAQWTKGTRAEVYAWAFPATIAGYFAWSLVEFNFDDKPFWEFLALYTALYMMVRKANEEGTAFPPLTGGLDPPGPSENLESDDSGEVEGS